jgi:hypothetical protein
MKTILRILTILLIGALVSGGMYLILGNTTEGSEMSGAPSFDQSSASADGESSQPPVRPEGAGHDNASLTRGLSEVSASLAKLAGITMVVLIVQSVIARLPRRKIVKLMDG